MSVRANRAWAVRRQRPSWLRAPKRVWVLPEPVWPKQMQLKSGVRGSAAVRKGRIEVVKRSWFVRLASKVLSKENSFWKAKVNLFE